MTPERLLAALRESMPGTLSVGGLYCNDVAIAWLLGVKPGRTIRDMRDAGRLPPGVKVARSWRYDLADVATWLDQQKLDVNRREAAGSGG